MTKKYYIASRLENAEEVRDLKRILDAEGWQHTYDWTTAGSVTGDPEAIRNVAILETQGVVDADVLIALLPGGRGTHCEIGMALALGKPVYLLSYDRNDFETTRKTCAFYHHPLVYQFTNWLDLLMCLTVKS